MSNKDTQFKPGQSGNPDGRPKKGYSISEWFREMLASNPEVRAALGKSITKKALEGDVTAQKLVWSYMDGMPSQAIEQKLEVTHVIPILGGVSNVPINDSNPKTT